ncbi:hypothetical protein jhhlp_006511, partial [Lomentospora prolificans]
ALFYPSFLLKNQQHTMTTPDIAAIRANFPSLTQDQVFFDSAGGSQVLGAVVSSITTHYTVSNVQLGPTYAAARLAVSNYTAAYAATARFLNTNPNQIVFGASTTQLLRNLAHALQFEKGDEIVVSAVDHESNISPWLDLAERQGLVVKWWKPERLDDSDASGLLALITDKTKLVAVTHASNVLGVINPIRKIADAAHAHGALIAVDGVAYAPYRPIDVAALDVDFYVFSWYKVFGPHISTLYASTRAFPRVRSLGHYFLDTNTLEGKLGLAGAAYELLQAIPVVIDYLGPTDGPMRHDIELNQNIILRPLLAYLAADPDRFTVYGGAILHPNRLPVVSFSVKGWSSRQVVEEVEKVSNIGIRWGHFYAPRLVGEILGRLKDGLDGIIRVSFAHYNSLEEVERFITVLDSVLSKAPAA